MSSPIAYLVGTGLIFSFLFLTSPILGRSESLSVAVNEIAWMGTVNSANDEWVELYNNTDDSVNLDGWQLIAQDGTPKITLSGIISANGFYLLERTNDDTVPGISADKIYTGALGNNGENLKLYDNLNNIVDEVNCSEKWLAGDNAAKQTMEKTSTGWQTSENPRGTPKSQNSAGAIVKTELTPAENNRQGATEENQKTETTPTKTIVYPDGIVLNEILPSPEGPDETDEWAEISNRNNFEVDISGWKIKDSVGKSTTYIFSKGTNIPSHGLLTLSRQTTRITLNNDGDEMFLLKPDGKIADSVSYGKAPIGQSYNKTESGWAWSDILTPGMDNKISEAKPPQVSPLQGSLRSSLLAGKEKENQVKEERASAGRQFSEKFPVFLSASILAIFSGAIILLLKMKLKI